MSHSRILLLCWSLAPILAIISMSEKSAVSAEEVQVYRVQVGAYRTHEEAEAALAAWPEALRSSLRMVEKPGPYPFKLQGEDWPSLEKAREALVQTYKAIASDAFVVMERVDAAALPEQWASAVLPSIHSEYLETLVPHPELGPYELVRMAQEARSQGDYDTERAAWSELLVRFPASEQVPLAHLRLGRFYYALYFNYGSGTRTSDDPHIRRRCLEEARRQFLTVIEKYPDSPQSRNARFFLGLTVYHLGDYGIKHQALLEAVQWIESASAQLALEPWEHLQYIGYRLELARNLKDKSAFERVVAEADTYDRCHPEAPLEYRSRAAVMKLEATEEMQDYEPLQDYTKVIVLASQLISRYIEDASSLLNIQRARYIQGRCLQRLGKCEEASESYALYLADSAGKGVTISAMHEQSLLVNLGICKERAGLMDEAIYCYRQAAELTTQPGWTEMAYTYLFDCYIRLGRLDLAREVYEQVQRINSECPHLVNMRICLERGMPIRARP